MSMTPKISVRPAASRNNISPNCRPFSACSRTKIPVIAGGLLHRALLHVSVAVILEDRLVERLVDQSALAVGTNGAHVIVLDRILIRVEAKRSAHRIELGVLQRLA